MVKIKWILLTIDSSTEPIWICEGETHKCVKECPFEAIAIKYDVVYCNFAKEIKEELKVVLVTSLLKLKRREFLGVLKMLNMR